MRFSMVVADGDARSRGRPPVFWGLKPMAGERLASEPDSMTTTQPVAAADERARELSIGAIGDGS
jgi:hypothetical protein